MCECRLYAVQAASGPTGPKPTQKISGYTPANFISYAEGEENRCHHLVAVEVEAPSATCFALWNDWNRIVDYMDLVSQVRVAGCLGMLWCKGEPAHFRCKDVGHAWPACRHRQYPWCTD